MSHKIFEKHDVGAKIRPVDAELDGKEGNLMAAKADALTADEKRRLERLSYCKDGEKAMQAVQILGSGLKDENSCRACADNLESIVKMNENLNVEAVKELRIGLSDDVSHVDCLIALGDCGSLLRLGDRECVAAANQTWTGSENTLKEWALMVREQYRIGETAGSQTVS